MQLRIISVGKTDSKAIQQLTEDYQNRLKHYIKCEWVVIPDIKNSKNLTFAQQKQKEGQEILSKIQVADVVVLLDEKGKQFSSMQFADWLQKKMNQGIKQLVLVIGGPYGFSEEVYERADQKISLSAMTFSHQMVRLFLTEQLYRAMTILRNENYHHE
ncbi:MAG: 23S rRNA (pseudouridine(1915)-N(3))-methyltransferase RlmH [Flavobacteriales bacterium]|jgi:23S rRNA (pseudouridine1915-N3)-methyltransferase|nr:23S rRNA (pseudouridine(1915)-N(3))-methyltransferase RlmH [Flavobacteriales bacterium]